VCLHILHVRHFLDVSPRVKQTIDERIFVARVLIRGRREDDKQINQSENRVIRLRRFITLDDFSRRALAPRRRKIKVAKQHRRLVCWGGNYSFTGINLAPRPGSLRTLARSFVSLQISQLYSNHRNRRRSTSVTAQHYCERRADIAFLRLCSKPWESLQTRSNVYKLLLV
jgi:hypothetical protein